MVHCSTSPPLFALINSYLYKNDVNSYLKATVVVYNPKPFPLVSMGLEYVIPGKSGRAEVSKRGGSKALILKCYLYASFKNQNNFSNI